MAKKELPEDEGVSQEWLASYADAMTLLLAFFIMMFAFALIDEAKYFDFKVGVTAALGVPDPLTDNTDSILEKGTGITPEIGFTPVTPTEEQEAAEGELRESLASAGTVTVENAEELREYLELEFELAGAGEYVEVGIDDRGVFIRFDGRVLFESGEAELDEAGLILLATASDVLSLVDNGLEVEGHTDDQPTNGGTWPSNWELSTARASRVVRWMIDPGELPPLRLTAIGRADTRPRASNATDEGRQQNRRVEIVTRIAQISTSEDEQLVDRAGPEGDPPDVLADDGADPSEPTVLEPGTSGGDGESTPPLFDDPIAERPQTLDDITTIDPIGDPTGDPLNPTP